MIRPLRRAHRLCALALALLLPVLVLLTLALRPAEPVQRSWPSSLRTDGPEAAR
jgi:hypothetical protein